MRDRPAGPELKALVDRAEAGDPALGAPADERYRGLLIARARQIAARHEAAGDGPEKQEREALSGLLGQEGTLRDLNEALARAIRAGDYDPGRPDADAVGAHLWRTTLQRVRESNPKALKS